MHKITVNQQIILLCETYGNYLEGENNDQTAKLASDRKKRKSVVYEEKRNKV